MHSFILIYFMELTVNVKIPQQRKHYLWHHIANNSINVKHYFQPVNELFSYVQINGAKNVNKINKEDIYLATKNIYLYRC